jgi:hypothetical protein
MTTLFKSFLPLLLLASSTALLLGCSSDSDSDSPAPPAPESLFDNLPGPSPNKLRGVYQTTVEQASGTVEIRLRFTQGYVVGAGKCTYKTAGVEPITVGGSVTVDALDNATLDAATGKVTIQTLNFQKTVGNATCQAGLQGASYDFKVEEDKLTLSVPGAINSLSFKKIGD